MKNLNLLLAILIGATLFSCSSNDDNPTPPTPEIKLDKFEQKIYNNEVLDRIIVVDFNNNRLEKSYSIVQKMF